MVDVVVAVVGCWRILGCGSASWTAGGKEDAGLLAGMYGKDWDWNKEGII